MMPASAPFRRLWHLSETSNRVAMSCHRSSSHQSAESSACPGVSGGGSGPEGSLVGVRGHVVDPVEVRAHLVCGSEAAQGCDALDGVVGVLEQVLRAADSLGA